MSNRPIPVVLIGSASPSTVNAPPSDTPTVSSNEGYTTLFAGWTIRDHEIRQRALTARLETWRLLATVPIPSARLMGMSFDSQRCLAENIREQEQECIFVPGHAPEEPTIDPRLLEPADPAELLEKLCPKRGYFGQNVRPKSYPRRLRKPTVPTKQSAGGRPGTRLRQATGADEMEGEDNLDSGDETEPEDWS